MAVSVRAWYPWAHGNRGYPHFRLDVYKRQVGIQAGAGGGHQISGDVLAADTRVFLQKGRNVGLHTLGKGGVGGGVVVGAGAQAGKRGAVVVILLYLSLIHILIKFRTATSSSTTKINGLFMQIYLPGWYRKCKHSPMR